MLLAFAMFGISAAVGLISFVLYLYPGIFGGRDTSIPGPLSSDSREGNLLDIAKEEGSLHRFLLQVHKQFGHVVAFHMGKQLVVSLASLDAVTEHMRAFNDKPGLLFQLFEPIVPRHLTNKTGTMKAASSRGDAALGRQQKLQESKVSSLCWAGTSSQFLFGRYVALAYELANKWMVQTTSTTGKLRHIPLVASSLGLGAKAASVTLLGDFYADDRIVFEFKRKADKYWAEVSDRLLDGSQISERREKAIKESLEELQRVMQGHVQCWFEAERATPPSRWTMTDYLMDKDLPQDEVAHQLLSYFLVLLNTVGHIFSWTIYSLARNPSVHDRLVLELRQSYASQGVDAMTSEGLESCSYLHRVVMETLRHIPVVTWSSRQQEFEFEVASHVVPKETLVLYSVGELCHDREIWSKPNVFNPDRFQDPNLEEIMRTLLPIPKPSDYTAMFPCFSSAYVVACVLVAEISQKFHFHLETEGPTPQETEGGSSEFGAGEFGCGDAPKHFKMLTTPKQEIWVSVAPREPTPKT